MLNARDEELLIALRRGNHFPGNPGDVTELFHKLFAVTEASEGLSSARRLHADGLALLAQDAEKLGRAFLCITDTGIAYADIIIEQRRPRTWKEHIAGFTRSDWIALGAFLVSLFALFKGW